MADAIYNLTVYDAWTRGRQPAKTTARKDSVQLQRPDKHEPEQCRHGGEEAAECPSQISRC